MLYIYIGPCWLRKDESNNMSCHCSIWYVNYCNSKYMIWCGPHYLSPTLIDCLVISRWQLERGVTWHLVLRDRSQEAIYITRHTDYIVTLDQMFSFLYSFHHFLHGFAWSLEQLTYYLYHLHYLRTNRYIKTISRKNKIPHINF